MRRSWTDAQVEAELAGVVARYDGMPTVSALRVMGRNDLACQISRRGGFIEWANRIGVRRGASDSDTGWEGERALAALIESHGLTVERMSAVKAPYDLRVCDSVRVDVKSARYAEYGVCRGWFYRVGKEPQADVIALYQLDTGACYFLPWQICPRSNVTISRSGGKYAAYLNRYDLLTKLADARSSELVQLWKPL